MSDLAPDPATNSTPPSNVSTLVMPETNWDYLDTPASMPPGDAPESFEEDDFEDRAKPDEPPADTKPDVTAPADDTPPAPSDEAKTDAPAELSAEVKERVEYFEKFDEALKAAPDTVARAIFEGMDARQKASFLQEIGVAKTDYPEFNIEEYEPGSSEAMEADLKNRYADIRSIPHIIAENRALDAKIGEAHDGFQKAFQSIVPHVAESNVMSELALAKIDAICKAFNITLPDPDAESLRKEIKPGVTYRDAVRKVVNYDTAVELSKQAQAKRPKDTGGNTSKREGPPQGSENWSAVEWARHFGTIPKR